MSELFANTLRARDGVITIGDVATGPVIRFRAAMPENVWDVVRIDAPASASIHTVKAHALNALKPNAMFADEFSVKLNGCEIFDESVLLGDAGVMDGSTLLLAHRRRRPVRS
jgi:hypothetical protein